MSELDPKANIEGGSGAIVRQLKIEDIPALAEIITEWVRNPQSGEVIESEVAEIATNLEGSLTGETTDKQYIVAEEGGEVVGMMGLAMPSELMTSHARTEYPVEIINAFVSGKSRGMGVGGSLLEAVFASARFIGATEVMVNSGPRYQATAWGFYDKAFGGRLTTLKDHYGPGLDAPVWSKIL